jgi:hypothetical protein
LISSCKHYFYKYQWIQIINESWQQLEK